MLTELARQVGLALHNVELDSALQESPRRGPPPGRRAAGLAGPHRRRRPTRPGARSSANLHDGAQQHLVALAVNVRLARQLAETDPEASVELLDQLGPRLAEAPSRSSGPWPTASTRPCSSTGASTRRCGRPPAGPRCRPRSRPRASSRHSPERGGGRLLLLHGGAAERGQARRRRTPPSPSACGRSRGWLNFEVADTGAGFDADGGAGKGAGFVNMATGWGRSAAPSR